MAWQLALGGGIYVTYSIFGAPFYDRLLAAAQAQPPHPSPRPANCSLSCAARPSLRAVTRARWHAAWRQAEGTATFLVFFKIWATPAWLVLGLWFAIQLFNEVTSGASGGVAHMAHIGGFVAGALLTLPLWYRLGGPLFWRLTHGHPPFPEARERQTNIPTVTRRR